MKEHELDIDSIVFIELKNRINAAIAGAVKAMREKYLTEGTVSAKIKISVIQTVDEQGEIHSSAVFEPKVTTKIGSSEEVKCGATGGKVTINEAGQVLIGSEQVTMDELMDDKKGA